MEIKPIKTQKDYRSALKIVSRLVDLDPAPNTPEGDHLELLGTLVEAWERRHFPIEDPSAIEAIRFRMVQGWVDTKDEALNSRSPSNRYATSGPLFPAL
jgi:HTH-type transcriptional regulator / antitoxin HigA